MNITRTLLTALALLAPVLGYSAAPLTITAAWVRATPPGVTTAAAYFTITNNGTAEERLLGATSPAARTAELHTSVEEHGMQHMRPLAEVVIPAGGSVELATGGMHIMLIDIAAPMKPGEEVPLTLHFAHAGDLTIGVPVRDARMEMHHH
jgi:copper(I)-binding protein